MYNKRIKQIEVTFFDGEKVTVDAFVDIRQTLEEAVNRQTTWNVEFMAIVNNGIHPDGRRDKPATRWPN